MRVVWAAYPEWDRYPREQLAGWLEGEKENWTARMRSANELVGLRRGLTLSEAGANRLGLGCWHRPS